MRLTFLGTGTSFGVPQIGCDCPVCRSTDPRDKRTRSGAILQEGGATILIDTPPELRLQLIAGGFSRIDAVVYTHEHADHINGIDDLRIFSVRRRRPLPVYGPRGDAGAAARAPSITSSMTSVRPYEGTSKPPLEVHEVEPGRPVTHGRGRSAAARLPARPPAGVRLPIRQARLHHRREGDSRCGARAAPRPRGAGAERALVAAASHPPQHRRGGGDRPGAGGAAHLPDSPDARDRARRAGGAAARRA